MWRHSYIEHITSNNTSSTLKDSVAVITEDVIGIKVIHVGTHSVRLGDDMDMYLGECPTYTMMMIGGRSGDVFH